MADNEIKVIEVDIATEVSLSLHIGGSFSFKWQLYEYPTAGGEPKALDEERAGVLAVSIGKLAPGVTRRFVWSVAVVSDDELEKTVDVIGYVKAASKTIGQVKGTLVVSRPLKKAFVNLLVKGKGT